MILYVCLYANIIKSCLFVKSLYILDTKKFPKLAHRNMFYNRKHASGLSMLAEAFKQRHQKHIYKVNKSVIDIKRRFRAETFVATKTCFILEKTLLG